MRRNSSTDVASLVEMLRARADGAPAAHAVTFLADGEMDARHVTFADLDRQARSIAVHLARHARPGDRVLLLYPAELEFGAAFFGCLYAGAIAVPAFSPRIPGAAARVAAIAEDCQPSAVMTDAASIEAITECLAENSLARGLPVLCADDLPDASGAWRRSDARRETPAFLQYTSGSTSLPKGVVVTHGNLLHNMRAIAEMAPVPPGSVIVSWLPHYHDMGLVLNVAMPVFAASHAVVMSPRHFLERPARWLEAITKYGGGICAAPNFAYNLCARAVTPFERETLRLDSWHCAACGAEPIHSETIARFTESFSACGFKRTAFRPAYGLAENTLLVSMSALETEPRVLTVDAHALGEGRVQAGSVRHLVSCGRVAIGVEVRIVDPETRQPCPPNRIGEIWVGGGSVAKGYWMRPEATRETFEGYLDTGEGPFLRTGDLGFLDEAELIVTGRRKELIIVHGLNHYPHDIEASVERAHSALRPNAGAAFSVDVDGEERLVVVYEVTPEAAESANPDVIASAVRRAVSERHDLSLHALVLCAPDTIPRTLTNKIQRAACRQAFLDNTLHAVAQSPPRSARGAGCGAPREPIAIVGMACRFPGADGLDAFWRLLRDKVDAIRTVPAERWDADAVYAPEPGTPNKTNTKWGGFLEDVDAFDAAFFGISPREAAAMDPQQRLLLEVSWHALENAGIVPEELAGSTTGVFVGIGPIDYIQRQLLEGAESSAYAATGNAAAIAANRLSYFYDFRGPSVALDTACSASLVAVHQACQSLRAGECRVALVGAVNLMLSPFATLCLSQAHMLSSSGRCRSFDAGADGYVRGEGCGIVVLKPLSEALAARDPVLAVIRGTAINHDGRSNGLAAPNTVAQQAVMRAALEDAGVAPSEVSYLEAHGTGTPLGDPIEFASIKAVLLEGRAQDAPCLFGSVKTNIGHLETAAGMAGLIKTVLALRHEAIPAHLHLESINPLIRIEGLPIDIPTETVRWPRDEKPRIAGVSAFGFGGANAHVVVEEAPLIDPARRPRRVEAPCHVLVLSARNEEALRAVAGRHASWLDEHSDVPLADYCYTANTSRAHFPHRLACVVQREEAAALRDQLRAYAGGETVAGMLLGQGTSGHKPKLAYLFSGQGAQYPGMGRALYEQEPAFRDALDACAAILDRCLGEPLLGVMFSDDRNARGLLDETAYTQPALFALEYALAMLWRSWGVEPDVLLGHSVGEIAAACFAGAMPLEDGLHLIAERGRLIQSLPAGGAMAAVFADRNTAASVLSKYNGSLVIAAANGPELQTISGTSESLAEALAEFSAQGVRAKAMNVSHAFHSPLLEPILDAFASVAAGISYAPLRIPLVSNRDGRAMAAGEMLDAAYWRAHVRNTVEFVAGMRALEAAQCTAFLEIGPGNTLLGMGRRCINPKDVVWLPTLDKRDGDCRTPLSSLAALHVRGVQVDWKAVGQSGGHLTLPTYPFQRKRYWFTPGRGVESSRPASNAAEAIAPWLYQVDWKPLGAPQCGAENTAPGSWLIFADDGGVAEKLGARLESAGATPILVSHADPLDFEQVRLLLGAWLASDGPPFRGIVSLSGLGEMAGPDTGGSAIEQTWAAACTRVLYLLQAMMRHVPKDAGTRLYIVTRGVQRVAAEDPPANFAQAPVWGLARTAAIECPGGLGKMIDLSLEPRSEDAQAIADELRDSSDESMVAVRANGRFGARLVHAQVASERQTLRCAAEGAWLVTGGFGGLGGVVARQLVASGARRLILLSRAGLPPRTDWARVDAASASAQRIALVKELERSGVSVHAPAVDVGDESALREFLDTYAREQWPPIRGVVHLAGVLEDRSLEQMDAADFAPVLHAKAAAAWNLHRAFQDVPLDRFILFSSAASLLGAAGQGNYAAANACLDALAHFRAAQGLPALSIDWGPWAEVGMAARPDRGARMALHGVRSIAPERGAAAFAQLWNCEQTQVGVIDADWDQLAAAFWHLRAEPFLSEIPALRPEPAPGEIAARIHATFGDERKALIFEQIRCAAAAVLGLDASEIPDDQNIVALGFDSIMAMDLMRILTRTIDFRVFPREVFNEPTLDALAEHIAIELDIQQRKRAGDAPPEEGYLQAHLRKVMRAIPASAPLERRNPPCMFLLASPRSGSTLLRVMLSAHPALFCPPELHLLGYPDMAVRETAVGGARFLGDGVGRALMEIYRMPAEEAQILERGLIEKRMPVQEVYRMIQEAAQPRLLVDKSPSYSGVLEVLELAERMFDNARYLFLYRHPYSCIASYVRNRTGRMFDFGHADPYLLAEEVWRTHNRNILTFLESIPAERQFRVRYEDLVREAEAHMRRLCAWLEIPYDAGMLAPYERGTMLDGMRPDRAATGDPNFMRHAAIDPALSDAWKRVALPRPLETGARRIADTLGYALPAEQRTDARTPIAALDFEEERL